MYEKRKQREGGDRKSKEYQKSLGQNDPVNCDTIDEESITVEPPKSTAEQMAEELGVSEKTVKRNAQYAKAIDKIEEIDEEVAQKILSEER